MAKKTGVQAIEEREIHKQIRGLSHSDMQLVFFAQYVLTYDPGWYPGDWPKDPDLLAAPQKLPFIERVAYAGKLLAIEWERCRDQGGFANPKLGIG